MMMLDLAVFLLSLVTLGIQLNAIFDKNENDKLNIECKLQGGVYIPSNVKSIRNCIKIEKYTVIPLKD